MKADEKTILIGKLAELIEKIDEISEYIMK